MVRGNSGHEAANESASPSNVAVAVAVATTKVNSSSGGSSARGGKKLGIMDMFLMQMRENSKVRAHERSEAAKDR